MLSLVKRFCFWNSVGVQGVSESQRELLDAESVTGHLLPAGSVFAFLAAHRLALFPASMFTDLFSTGRGRPSIPPDVVASVLVLRSCTVCPIGRRRRRCCSTCGGRPRAGWRSQIPRFIRRR